MKNTKGVRQVLEKIVNKCDHDMSQWHTWVDEAEATLQEIMLGMLPEKYTPAEKMQGIDGSADWREGFDTAIKLMEQNIREALKDKE